MTLVGEHCKGKKNISDVRCRYVFLSIRLSDPTPVFFQLRAYQTAWEQEMMGNINIFLVLSFCGK